MKDVSIGLDKEADTQEQKVMLDKEDYKVTGLKEEDARKIMRQNLKPKSFKVWRKRVSGRNTKHMALKDSTRFKSTHKRKL